MIVSVWEIVGILFDSKETLSRNLNSSFQGKNRINQSDLLSLKYNFEKERVSD